jgi:hypothetical protein
MANRTALIVDRLGENFPMTDCAISDVHGGTILNEFRNFLLRLSSNLAMT